MTTDPKLTPADHNKTTTDQKNVKDAEKVERMAKTNEDAVVLLWSALVSFGSVVVRCGSIVVISHTDVEWLCTQILPSVVRETSPKDSTNHIRSAV